MAAMVDPDPWYVRLPIQGVLVYLVSWVVCRWVLLVANATSVSVRGRSLSPSTFRRIGDWAFFVPILPTIVFWAWVYWGDRRGRYDVLGGSQRRPTMSNGVEERYSVAGWLFRTSQSPSSSGVMRTS